MFEPSQVALVWDDMLRTVPLSDIKVKYSEQICVALGMFQFTIYAI